MCVCVLIPVIYQRKRERTAPVAGQTEVMEEMWCDKRWRGCKVAGGGGGQRIGHRNVSARKGNDKKEGEERRNERKRGEEERGGGGHGCIM